MKKKIFYCLIFSLIFNSCSFFKKLEHKNPLDPKSNEYYKLEQLTIDIADDEWPRWSQDGTKIAFSSTRITQNYNVFIINSDDFKEKNMTAKQLTPDTGYKYSGYTLAWSPIDNKIFFCSEVITGTKTIWGIKADDFLNQNKTLAYKPYGNLFEGFDGICFVQQGSEIVYTSYGIRSLPYPEMEKQEKIITTNFDDSFPSGYNNKIIFSSFKRANNSELYIVENKEIGEVKRITYFPTSSELYADFFPDGNKIVFSSDRKGLGDFDLWMMNLDGSNLKQLTYDIANDYQPQVSPDGNKIAFVSDRTGNFDIWILYLK